jgi:hypothetical protein
MHQGAGVASRKASKTMTVVEHNKILGIGFAVFVVIFGLTILLLLVVSLGVFVALGISFANETGNSQEAGIGVLGVCGGRLLWVIGDNLCGPSGLASRKMLKRRRKELSQSLI